MKQIYKYEDIPSHLARYVKERRKHLGLSMDDLSKRISVSKTHIWSLEKGRSKNPSLWLLIGLCDGLQCSLNDLLGRDVSQPIFTDSEMALIDAHRRIFSEPQLPTSPPTQPSAES